jgi:D-beta-D-heptose 7-phosphate kinase/D-beta-D-heptose 1-phosphate adenosyltransferase
MAVGAASRDAIHHAKAAAGIVVGKAGTSSVTPGEVLGEIASGVDTDISSVLEKISMWRQDGLTIGFTNGCFDQLHPGHIRVLEKAAGCCDRLIVGLNSDSSTRKLKGEGRPIQSEDIRAAVLASLPMVSAVAIFSEKTPARLIRRIMPERLIKGGDYTPNQVVGADLVRSNGGKVIIVPIRQGYSTTRLSQR